MNRRPRLPGADELFRATAGAAGSPAAAASGGPTRGSAALVGPARTPRVSRAVESAPDADWAAGGDGALNGTPNGGGHVAASSDLFDERHDDVTGRARPVRITRRGDARPTGRERHDEKITVYCSPEELLQLEHARLALRAAHGLAVDRGRIVREAVAVVLADLEAKGDASILVRRLRGR
jgi:hypothetical protein